MSKHTKGPWVAGKNGVIKAGPMIQFARGQIQRQIAMACSVPDDVDGDQEANTRLIAAAPELLEALRKILKCEEDRARDLRHRKAWELVKFCEQRMEAARAAIAKATGAP